jgi:hypothetical protein
MNILILLTLLFSAVGALAEPIPQPPTQSSETELSSPTSPADIQLSPPTNVVEVDPGVDIPLPDLDGFAKRQSQSAGLYFGPVGVGNLQVYLTKPHTGSVGNDARFGTNAWHVNFHVDRQKNPPAEGWKPLYNLHIHLYTQDGRKCLWVWDGVAKKKVYDNCTGNWGSAIKEAIAASKDVVQKILKAANFLAAVAVLAAVTVALATLLGSMTAAAVAV